MNELLPFTLKELHMYHPDTLTIEIKALEKQQLQKDHLSLFFKADEIPM